MITRRPTQVDVARLAGVSRQTVSLVARDDPRVSAGRRDAVRAAMDRLGYRPNVAARALAARRTGFVGICLSDLVNPFHGELIELIRAQCEEVGLTPFITPVGQVAAEEKLALDRFMEMNVDGLILVSPVIEDETLDRVGRQVPTVVVTRNAGPDSVDLVHSDDRAGARMVVDRLLGSGYRPIIYLGPDRRVEGDSSRSRIRGYRDALDAARPGSSDSGGRGLGSGDAGSGALGGEDAGDRGLAARVEQVSAGGVGPAVARLVEQYGRGFGLCCHNDLIALEAIGNLEALGLRPGRDVGVTGFDNVAISAYPGIALTTVDQSTARMASAAVELLVARVEGRQERADVALHPRLVVRRSSERR